MYKIEYTNNTKPVTVKTLKEVRKIVKNLYPEPNIKRYGLLLTINNTDRACYYEDDNPNNFNIIATVSRI